MKELTLIIPCFNEEETLISFRDTCLKIEQDLSHHIIFSYIFVDDGSTDKTLAILRNLSESMTRMHYISFSRNFGKEAAILAGLEHSKGDYVAIMDADLQDPPELLIEMLDKIQEGYDIVATRRSNRDGEPWLRSILARLFYFLINLISDTKIVDGARDFRLMTRQVVDSVLELREVNRFSKGLFSWVGYKVAYISYENRKRVAGKTSWNFWSLLKYSIDGFINFSEAPLNLSIWAGLLSFVFSIFGIIFIITRKLLFGDPVSGWPSLVCLILCLGGLQLLALGIIGKYIAKIFLETKKRPIYLIKEKK